MVALVGLLTPGLQEYVTPEVVELPVNVAVVFVQVMVWVLPTLNVGCVVLDTTASVNVFLQPFAGLVTVRV